METPTPTPPPKPKSMAIKPSTHLLPPVEMTAFFGCGHSDWTPIRHQNKRWQGWNFVRPYLDPTEQQARQFNRRLRNGRFQTRRWASVNRCRRCINADYRQRKAATERRQRQQMTKGYGGTRMSNPIAFSGSGNFRSAYDITGRELFKLVLEAGAGGQGQWYIYGQGHIVRAIRGTLPAAKWAAIAVNNLDQHHGPCTWNAAEIQQVIEDPASAAKVADRPCRQTSECICRISLTPAQT